MDAGSRPPPPAVISFKTYHRLEDAWRGGLEAWCRAATGHVLAGGAAWLVAVSDAHANAIKHRLLQEGISVAGVRFLYARALRRELCLRLGIEPPVFGRETLELLLRLRAGDAGGELGPALEALEDFAAAGRDAVEDLPGCSEWLPILRSSGSWTPDLDRQITASVPGLRLCIAGWDAGFWPQFGLLKAALRCAEEAHLFLPLPRGEAETLQQSWLAGIEEAAGANASVCESAGAAPAQAALASRLEGVDLEESVPEPEWLVGAQWNDAVPLAADFVARWLVAREGNVDRLAIVAPGQSPAALALRRALEGAGIAVADEIGENSEPPLDAQLMAALASFHREGGDVEHLLSLVELLNERAAEAPIDPMGLRKALDGAFWEVQERGARALCSSPAFARTAVAGPVCQLLDRLAPWPASLRWDEAMARWETCLAGFGLAAEALEPSWSRWQQLPGDCAITASRFFEQVSFVLASARSRSRPSTANRFARVVLTNLDGASGRSWGGALFLDAIEGVWPVYPAQNPFLNDAARTRLNALRSQEQAHLLTAPDRAQLGHLHFLEILENCEGPLAFAGAARDALDCAQELYPNEFALRCLMETMPADCAGAGWLDRWGNAARRSPREMPALAPAEAAHLRRVHRRRRDPSAPFDEYHFNFEALASPDDLPWGEPWSLRDVRSAWARPASFALSHILDARPAHARQTFQRMENKAVGALMHHWLRQALRPPRDPAAVLPEAWRGVFLRRLDEAVRETAKAAGEPSPWRGGALARAQWAAASCLEAIAAGVSGPCFLASPQIETQIRTRAGGLRLRVSGDLMLLDRPELPGAVCWLIDVVSSQPASKVTSPTDWANGKHIGLEALWFACLAAGAREDALRLAVAHPGDAAPFALTPAYADAARSHLAQIAHWQRTSAFGQRPGSKPGGHEDRQGEHLPMATAPIAREILEAKMAALESALDSQGFPGHE